MKINIHDKFTSQRQFVGLVKWIYRYLDSYNLEVRNLTVYIATENKETKKIGTLYAKGKEGDEDKCYKDYRWKSLNKNRGDAK